jgi:hypothetical protein
MVRKACPEPSSVIRSEVEGRNKVRLEPVLSEVHPHAQVIRTLT